MPYYVLSGVVAEIWYTYVVCEASMCYLCWQPLGWEKGGAYDKVLVLWQVYMVPPLEVD